MTQPITTDTSVMVSLAELAGIEEHRLREEAAERTRRRRETELAEEARQEARRRAEEARVAADATRRVQLEREGEEARARATAREQAAVEVARIEAAGKARLAAENAEREHELKVLGLKNDTGRARLRHALAGLVGLVVLAGSAAAWAVSGHVTKLEQEARRLRDDRWAVTQGHDQALSSLLARLDQRHRTLRTRTATSISKQAALRAEAARGTIEAGGLTAPKLLAFSEALDALAVRVMLEAQVASLDRRFADLGGWARAMKKPELMDALKRAAAKAKAPAADDDAVSAYAGALDAVAKALGATGDSRSPGPPSAVSTTSTVVTRRCVNKHDPMCGFDGEVLGAK